MIEVSESQGAPVTPEILRSEYLSSGDAIITRAFEKLMGNIPPILEFRVLWIVEPGNLEVVRKLRHLWDDYAAGLASLSDRPLMQALFDKLVIDVSAIAVTPDAAPQIAPPVAKIQPLPHDQWPAPPDRATQEQQMRGFIDKDKRMVLREWIKHNAYPPEAAPHLPGDSTGDTLSKLTTDQLVQVMYGDIPAPAIDRIPGRVAPPKPAVSREIPPFTSEPATPPDDFSFFAVMDAGQMINWMIDNLWGGDQTVLDKMPLDQPWTTAELMEKIGQHYGWS